MYMYIYVKPVILQLLLEALEKKKHFYLVNRQFLPDAGKLLRKFF